MSRDVIPPPKILEIQTYSDMVVTNSEILLVILNSLRLRPKLEIVDILRSAIIILDVNPEDL